MLDKHPFNIRSFAGLSGFYIQSSYYLQLVKPYFYTF